MGVNIVDQFNKLDTIQHIALIVLAVVTVLVIYLLFRSNSCNENFDTNDSNVEAIKNLAAISKEIMTNTGTLTIPANNTNLSGDANIKGNLTVAPTSSFNLLPRGIVVAWSHIPIAAPEGWAICDGTLGTPDLRDRFILGGGSHLAFTTGGTETETLTIAQMPSHNHYINTAVFSANNNPSMVNNNDTGYPSGPRGDVIQPAGGNMPHNNMPPYYVLWYIMKL